MTAPRNPRFTGDRNEHQPIVSISPMSPVDPGLAALRFAGVYLVVSSVWIFFSDYILVALGLPDIQSELLGLIKGICFVTATSLLMYAALRRELIRGRRSGEFLRAMIDHTHDIVEIVDPSTGRFLDMNERGCADLGFSGSEIRTMGVRDIDPNMTEERYQLITEALERDGNYVFETWRRKKDGTEIPVEVSLNYVQLDHPYVLGIVHDIQKRRRSEEALHASEERFRNFFELGVAGMCIASPARDFIEVNSRLCSMLEYTREELLAKKWSDVTHPENLDSDLMQFNRVLTGEHDAYHTEKQFVAKSGRVIEATVSVRCVRNGDGSIKYFLAVVEDVTEAKRAQEKIRELSNAVEHSAASVIITDKSGSIEYVNPAFCRVSGYTPEEVIAKNPRFLKSGHTSGPEYRRLWETISAGKDWRGEFHNRKKTGELYWESASISPIMNDKGAITHFVAVKEDITEKKLTQEALQDSEKRFRALTENSHECIVLIKPDGTVTYASPAILRMLGNGPETYIGNNVMTFVHPEDRKSLLLIAARMTRGSNRRMSVSGRFQDREGMWRWIEGAASNLLKDPSVEAIVLNCRDVTAKKRADNLLREALSFTDRILGSTPVGILVYHLTGECILTNRAAGEIVGATEDELRKQDFRSLESWKESGLLRLAEEAMVRGKSGPEDFHLHTTFGRDCWVTARFATFESNGEKALLLTLSDISGRKNLEEQLRQAHKLESIGTLAGGIAHDFNNVLGIVMAYLTIVGREGTSPQKRTDAINTMNTAVKRGAALVRQLLTFARRSESTPEMLQVNTIIAELEKMLRATLPQMIAIEVQADAAIPMISADQVQLHQAILNLCVNARDAMPKGGVLRIQTSVVSSAEMPSKFFPLKHIQYVVISVADSGTGMDEETLKRIFEPFFTTKEIGKGTGLGLAVLYGVVSSHGGFVDVSSIVGRGTKFTLYLPVSISNVQQPSTNTPQIQKSGRGFETILLVEDEQSMLSFMEGQFRAHGYHVLTAENGTDALTLFKKHLPNISFVLSDFGLPKTSGLEAIRQMKVLKPDLKGMLASGNIDPESRKELRAIGAIDFVQKPYDVSEVLAKVRLALDRI